MVSGGVLVKDGTVLFLSQPWRTLQDISRKINARFSKGTPYGTNLDQTENRYKYIIDKLTSSFDMILPTDVAIDVSDATISLLGVPEKFTLPMYKKPTDKTLLSDFYKMMSDGIYNHFESTDHFEREALTYSWRSELYKTLMEICKDRGYSSLQISLQDQGIRPKLFADWEYSRDFRGKAFDWLTSRGEGWVTLEHKNGELKLSHDDFLKYFKDRWAKFAYSLHMVNINDRTPKIEFDLRYMQDFIMNFLAFIYELAESSVNKRIVLYPQTAYQDGYGISQSKYNPPENPDLNEWIISTSRNIGFILDLNDQNSIDEFVEIIPILLGKLLVEPSAFIVRDPDFDDIENDQCTFAFDMSGSLLPSQMIGTNRYKGPPTGGMRWTGGSEADYKRSNFYLKWNDILSRNDTTSIHRFRDPSKFYDICRRVLWILNI